jgi:hypothetical protein
MDLRQISYFVALFEEGSVTRAARRVNVVQPALSMQMLLPTPSLARVSGVKSAVYANIEPRLR